ncbi:MAG: translation initiation factor [Flavobacteriia bacterium]|nr:translation initiation factor [Flavobacteriia bacterium]
MKSSKKNRIDVVYSTNPNFNYQEESEEEMETLSNDKQKLYISIDRKQRAGKEVTLIEGFIGNFNDLEKLGKWIKSKCGVGGTSKDGTILIQGNFRDKIILLLEKEGYKTVRKGG